MHIKLNKKPCILVFAFLYLQYEIKSKAIMKIIKLNTFFAFCLAWLTTFTFASFSHSLMILIGLAQIDAQLTISDIFYHFVADWWGMLASYGVIIAVALCLAFLCVPLVKHFIFKRTSSTLLRIFAGGTVMALVLFAMQPILGVTLIAGARTPIGFILQINAGIMGGWLFAYLYSKYGRIITR